jgi:propionyl-CoA carboxylase alpha chain
VGSTPKPKAEYSYVVKDGNDVFQVKLWSGKNDGAWAIFVNDKEYHVVTPEFEYYRRRLKLKINDENLRFRMDFSGNFIWGAYCGITRTFEIYSPREWALAGFMPEPREQTANNILSSPMPGLIVDVMVKKGERVYRGQELVIMESMKMESGVASPCDGEVTDVMVKPGQAVETGDVMVKFAI